MVQVHTCTATIALSAMCTACNTLQHYQHSNNRAQPAALCRRNAVSAINNKFMSDCSMYAHVLYRCCMCDHAEFARSSRVLFTEEACARQQAASRRFIRVRAPQQLLDASTTAAKNHITNRCVYSCMYIHEHYILVLLHAFELFFTQLLKYTMIQQRIREVACRVHTLLVLTHCNIPHLLYALIRVS
jgi:hypothetical protein